MKGLTKKEKQTTSAPKEKKQHKFGNGKKIAVICAMVVLLVVAAYLNVLLTKKTQTNNLQNSTDSTSTVSVFAAMKADRDTVRAQTYSYLDSIINSETSSAEAKSAAEEKKLSLIEYSSEEVVLENLLKARGFAEVCVTVSQQNINVLVKDSDLDATEVAQILYVVTQETGCNATDVIVVPKS